MKTIGNRVRKLEDRMFPDNGEPQRLWVAVTYGLELALDQDRCIEILGEGGFLPKTRFGVVNLCGIPDGLNAKEMEKYLRTNGTQAPGFGGAQEHGRPGNRSQLDYTTRWSRAQISADWG